MSLYHTYIYMPFDVSIEEKGIDISASKTG